MDDHALLLEFARRRSSRAFSLLVERHIDLVYSAALRRVGGDPHRAADVTQQVFIDLANKAADLASHPVLAGWLHRSTRWAAASLRRTENRRTVREQAAARELAETTGPAEPTLDWHAVRERLDEALDRLRPDDRDAVLLRFFSNHSYAEIGRRLGIAENAARMRVDRALERLGIVLRRHGITSTAAALGLALSENAVAAAPAGLAANVSAAVLTGSSAVATGATATATGIALATKLQLAAILGLTAGLGLALHHALQERDREARALAAAQHRDLVLHEEVQRQQSALVATQADAARVDAQVAAETADPVQQRRAQLDLLIRRGELDQNYTPLFRELKLDDVTLDRVKTLLVQRNQAGYDALQAAKADGLELSATEDLEVRTAAARDIDAELTALMGPDRMQTLLHYEATLPIRMTILPASLVLDPARQQQTETLIGLFQKFAPTYFDDRIATGDWPPISQAFLDAAQPYLTARDREELELAARRFLNLRQLAAFTRAAAYAGKLTLDRNSAKAYAVPPASTLPVVQH